MAEQSDGQAFDDIADEIAQADGNGSGDTGAADGDAMSAEAELEAILAAGNGDEAGSGGSDYNWKDASWGQVWHLPLLLVGLALFAGGVALSWQEKEENDIPGGLDRIADALKVRETDLAEEELIIIQGVQDEMTELQIGRMKQYLGDLNFLQLNEGLEVPVRTEAADATRRRIVNFYDEAETSYGWVLDPNALLRYRNTLVMLDRLDDALKLIDRMPTAPAEPRYLAVRDLLEVKLGQTGTSKPTELLPLMSRFRDELARETDKTKELGQSIWLAQLETQLYLDHNDPDRAIRLLVERRLPRFQRHGTEAMLAPLHVQLAQAYQRVGDLDRSLFYFERARDAIDSGNDLNAAIQLGFAELLLAESDDPLVLQEALGHYTTVVRSFPSSELFVDALIGRGDVESRLNDESEESITHFRMAVDELVDRKPADDPRRELVHEVVRGHIARAKDREDYDRALRLLSLLTPMYPEGLPVPMLNGFAQAHENSGRRSLQIAEMNDPAVREEGRTPEEVAEARRLAYIEAAEHFRQSGNYYRQHARALSAIDDPGHGQSLWAAATNYDRAQMWDDAIAAYLDFVGGRADDADTQRARRHLGLAFMASGRSQLAIEHFEQLRNTHPQGQDTLLSLVPLANAYMQIGELGDAERILVNMVSRDPSITPESPEYAEALVQLGKLYYRMGDTEPTKYVDAVERLEMAVERYGMTGDGPRLRYLLADSYRQSIPGLDEEVEQRLSEKERDALLTERRRRLNRAQMFFDQVVTELDAKPMAALTDVEQLYLRNAYFYQADAAYDRGDYITAIDLYDRAARRYQNHPAAMVALVQIVNARCELQQWENAMVANTQAMSALERIPDEAFDDPTLPMSREHWESWLQWQAELGMFEDKPAQGG